MTFPLTPAGAFTASVSTISAATANAWRTYISQSLDTVNGGAYVNVTAINWSAGGAGWRFYSPLTVKSTGTFTLDSGATVTIAADPTLSGDLGVGLGGVGGSVRFYATSTMQIDNTVACSIAGDLTYTSDSVSVYQSGASLSLGCNTTWASTSVCVHSGSSTDTYQSGSSLTTNAGAFVNLTIGKTNAGTVTNGPLSVEVHETGSTDTYQSGSGLTTNAGSLVNLTIGKTNAGTVTNGPLAVETHEGGSSDTYQSGSSLNLDGTVTRTGKEVLSGAGAYRQLRGRNAADADDAAVNGKAYDIVSIALTSGVSRTFILDDGPVGVWLLFKIQANAAAAEFLNVNGTSGLVYSIAPGAGKVQTVEFIWNGGAWTTGVVGAAV